MDIEKNSNKALLKLVAKGTSGTVVLKIASLSFGLLINIMLARLLGVKGFGAYAFSLAWAGLLGVPAVMGLDSFLVRKISVYHNRREWNLMRGALTWANKNSFISSFSLGGLAILGALLTRSLMEPIVFETFCIAMFLVPITTSARIRQASLEGLNKVTLGQMPEQIIFPVLFIVLSSSLWLLFIESFSPQTVMTLRVVAIGIVLLFGIFLLNKVIPGNVKSAIPKFKTTEWFKISVPMMWLSGANVINSYCDSIMLGVFRDSAEVGLYTIAVSGAYLAVLILAGVNTSLSPIVAALYSKNNMDKLNEVVGKSANWIFFSGLILGILLVVFGYWFLFAFGKDFTQAKSVLNILVMGNIFMSLMGTAPVVLLMTDHERITMKGFGLGAALNIALNASFIPKWGMEGAAFATVISITVCYIFLTWVAYKELKVKTFPLLHF